MNKQKIIIYSKAAYRITALFVLIWLLIFLLKHPQLSRECVLQHPNGTIEHPGLYGNCEWMSEYANRKNIRELMDQKQKQFEDMGVWNYNYPQP